jgi:hypothetical protein
MTGSLLIPQTLLGRGWVTVGKECPDHPSPAHTVLAAVVLVVLPVDKSISIQVSFIVMP